MRVYIMQFDGPEALNRAFGLLLDAEVVEGSQVGPEPLQIRFLAKRADAESLIQRIYLQGGLTWCSGHAARIAASGPAEVG